MRNISHLKEPAQDIVQEAMAMLARNGPASNPAEILMFLLEVAASRYSLRERDIAALLAIVQVTMDVLAGVLGNLNDAVNAAIPANET